MIGRAISAPEQTAAAKPSPLAASRQLLLVTTKDWDAVPGKLRRFIRANAQSPWTEVGTGIPVVVGRNGLGWGKGINPAVNRLGPIKKEGDGKSPAGIFRLSSAFGLAEPAQMSSLKLPYQQLTVDVECVDDVKSTHYNSIVDRQRTAQPDWDSSEKMRAVGNPYRLGIVVEHNTHPRQPGGGSCIFMHLWQDNQTGTSGCTAMAPKNMETLLPWLDSAAQPVLVQLPQSEYKQLQKLWQLP